MNDSVFSATHSTITKSNNRFITQYTTDNAIDRLCNINTSEVFTGQIHVKSDPHPRTFTYNNCKRKEFSTPVGNCC